MIGTIVGAVSSVASNVSNTIKSAKANEYNAQEAQAQRIANRQNIENERFYNSPIAQSLRMKDAGFNPNAFMSQISSGNMSELPQAQSAPAYETSPTDFSDFTQGVATDLSNNNDLLIAQMNIASSQRIAANQVEYNYWAQQVRVDSAKALQQDAQSYGKDLQSNNQSFEKEMQNQRLAVTEKLQQLQQAFDKSENEKDRQLSRQRLDQEYLQFREQLEEQVRVNDEEISALHSKMAIAKMENQRKEVISMYEQELKAKEVRAQSIQNEILEYENSMKEIDKFFDYAQKGAETYSTIRGAGTWSNMQQESARHNQETERYQREKDSNAEKAKRYDANQYYLELIREGYTKAKAMEKTKEKFGL